MRKKMKTPGRKALAAVAVGLASAAMVFGAATAANAATGNPNGGIRNITMTANGGSFATPGTNGTLSFNRGDGQPAGQFTVNPNPGGTPDSTSWRVTLPQGLKFVPDASCPALSNTSIIAAECAISADGRIRTLSQWSINQTSSPNFDYNTTDQTWAVQSTGIISGNVSAVYTPWTGTTTTAPTASLPQAQIPGAGSNFAATGATGPVNGNYTLTGTAQPGASITVKDADGDVVGTATADANGNWSAQIPVDGTNPPLSITQTVGTDVSAPIEFNTAPLPVMNGVVAAGAIALAGLGFGGYRLLRRSRVMA